MLWLKWDIFFLFSLIMSPIICHMLRVVGAGGAETQASWSNQAKQIDLMEHGKQAENERDSKS